MKNMKRYLKRIFGALFSKLRDKVFLVSVVVASFIWLLSNLSDTYTYTITLPIVITGAVSDYDKDIIAKDDKIYYIDTKFFGKGLDLLQIMMKNKIIISPDDLIIEKLEGDNELYQVTIESIRTALASMFINVEVVNIINKKVILQTAFFSQKKVPLLSNIKVNAAGEYMQIGSLSIEPDSVMIYGTKSVVDTVTRVFSENIVISRPSDYIAGNVKIPRNINFEITPREAQYALEMERYTEVKRLMPISMYNKTKTYNYSIIPSVVEVTFNVAENVFSQFNPSDLVFYVDTAKKSIMGNSSSYVEDDKYLVQYSELPEGVQVRSVLPVAVSVYENIVNE